MTLRRCARTRTCSRRSSSPASRFARALAAEAVRRSPSPACRSAPLARPVSCGTLAFADALRLVRLRGESMEAAFPSGYGLAAVEGLDEARVEAIAAEARAAALPVYLSNVNAPTQIVVAGSDAALDAVTAEARRQGARQARRLAVAGPSHSRCCSRSPIACSERWPRWRCGRRRCRT